MAEQQPSTQRPDGTQTPIYNAVATPAVMTGIQNNYVLPNADIIRLASSANLNITGFINADGDNSTHPRVLLITNVGANQFNFLEENAGSVATNRFRTGPIGIITLLSNESACVWYDPTISRWRVYSVYGSTFVPDQAVVEVRASASIAIAGTVKIPFDTLEEFNGYLHYNFIAASNRIQILKTGIYRIGLQCEADHGLATPEAIDWDVRVNAGAPSFRQRRTQHAAATADQNGLGFETLISLTSFDFVEGFATAVTAGPMATIANRCRMIVERVG